MLFKGRSICFQVMGAIEHIHATSGRNLRGHREYLHTVSHQAKRLRHSIRGSSMVSREKSESQPEAAGWTLGIPGLCYLTVTQFERLVSTEEASQTCSVLCFHLRLDFGNSRKKDKQRPYSAEEYNALCLSPCSVSA